MIPVPLLPILKIQAEIELRFDSVVRIEDISIKINGGSVSIFGSFHLLFDFAVNR